MSVHESRKKSYGLVYIHWLHENGKKRFVNVEEKEIHIYRYWTREGELDGKLLAVGFGVGRVDSLGSLLLGLVLSLYQPMLSNQMLLGDGCTLAPRT